MHGAATMPPMRIEYISNPDTPTAINTKTTGTKNKIPNICVRSKSAILATPHHFQTVLGMTCLALYVILAGIAKIGIIQMVAEPARVPYGYVHLAMRADL